MAFNVQAVVAEIDGVLNRFDDAFAKYGKKVQGSGRDSSAFMAPAEVRMEIFTLIRETIKRLAPRADYGNNQFERYHGEDQTIAHVGILRALRDDYANGRILSVHERIRSDVFSDFLEIAEYLIEDEGLKDPAAVLAGGVLEEHLRKLCDKHGVPTTSTDSKGKTHPKRLDALNGELGNQAVYSKNEQKQITAWAGIRNDAAHANFGSYTGEQVKLMIAGIRDFLNRHPG